jgi:hypothetical protein
MPTLSYYSEPTRYYAVGWSTETLPELPAWPAALLADPAFQQLQPWHWIYTGTIWAPCPDVLWPLWQQARHQPVTAEDFLHALASVLPDPAEHLDLWHILCTVPIFLPWPWHTAGDANGFIEPACWHLAATSGVPNPWPEMIPDTLWSRTPSLYLLGEALAPFMPSPYFFLEKELPTVVAQTRAHWILHRTTRWSQEALTLLAQEIDHTLS